MERTDSEYVKEAISQKEHSLAFRCFIGAAAIVLLTVSVHILVFTAIENTAR